MNKKSKISEKVYQSTYTKFQSHRGIVAPIYATKVISVNMLYCTDDNLRKNLLNMFSTDPNQRVKIGYVAAIKLPDGTLQFSTALCSPSDYFQPGDNTFCANRFDAKYGKFLAMTKALSGDGKHSPTMKDSNIIIKGSGIYYFSGGNTVVSQYNKFVERSWRYFFPETCPVVSDEGNVKALV